MESAHPTKIQHPVKRAMIAGTLVVLIVLLGGCSNSGGGTDDASQESAPVLTPADIETSNDATAIVPTPSGPTPPSGPTTEGVPKDPEVARAVEKLLSGQQGVIGIVLTRADGTIAYQQNVDIPFVAASLY